MVCAAFRDGVRPVDEVEATSVPVAGKDQTISGMAGRYATALFELALENKAVDAVKKDLDQFDALIAESADLSRLVRSPVFDADEQLKASSAVLAKAGIGGLAANFLRVITTNRRLFAVRDMIRGYRALVARHKGTGSTDEAANFACVAAPPPSPPAKATTSAMR